MARLRDTTLRQIQEGGPGAFVVASVILGVLVGLGAAILVLVIEGVHAVVDETTEASGTKLVLIAAVVAGMVLTWAIDRLLGPGVAGGGVGEVLSAMSLEGGYLPTRLVPGKVLATGLSLGTGGSGGREGPIVLIGAAIGSTFARYSRFGQDEVQAFVAAGAGAGIGAVFDAPIAGMLFALEVLLGSLAIRHLNAVVVVSVVASVTTHAIIGEDSILRSPPYELTDPRQLVLFALLALIVVGFGYLFLRAMHLADSIGSGWQPTWLKPVAAGLLVGLVGLARPEALGTGQEFLRGLLRQVEAGDLAWGLLVIIAVAKSFTAATTHGGGGSVGSFMPSMVIGGTVGAGFAVIAGQLWSLSVLNPGAFALVGMAAMLTVVVRAPLTAILLVFELTGDYGMILPLMLTVAIATVVADRMHPGSTYVATLRLKGIHLPQHEDRDVLDTVQVRNVMTWVPTVDETSTVAEVARLIEVTGHHGIPVVDDADAPVGIVTVSDLDTASLLDDTRDVPVQRVMTEPPITASPHMPVSAALARMASLDLGRLPVIDATGKLVGMFRRESVVRAYHYGLTRSISNELYRARINLRISRHTDIFTVMIRDGSPAIDARVREIAWPPEATLVSIRRQQNVIIPRGDTLIRMGDELTIYCGVEHRGAVRGLLQAPIKGPE